jgi:hypothetical protein
MDQWQAGHGSPTTMRKKKARCLASLLFVLTFFSLCRILARQINGCQSPEGTWISILGELLFSVGS